MREQWANICCVIQRFFPSFEIELHAQSTDWNDLLWLISTALRESGGAYTGEDYASLRNNLPVVFH